MLAAATALLLTGSARAEGSPAQGEAAPTSAKAPKPGEPGEPPRANASKHAKNHGKSAEARKPAAKAPDTQQEKAKPCEEVKPCAIE